MAPRKLHQQALYLEPEKATLLDQLATESRIPKAVLLREAVDDLLAKHGLGMSNSHEILKEVLKRSRPILVRYRTRTEEGLWHRKIDEAVAEIDRAKDAFSIQD